MRIFTSPAYAHHVEAFLQDGQRTRLSQAALETLAVIAYRQPVTRGRVSAIRGVNVDGVVRTLLSRGLIVEVGSDPETGGGLYRTTELFLERMGLEVMGVARSSEEAEQLLAVQRPDLIIMDIYLKGDRSGLELAEDILRRFPVPIIFLTASTDPAKMERIRSMPGCHYLSKPVTSESLTDVLQRALRPHGNH